MLELFLETGRLPSEIEAEFDLMGIAELVATMKERDKQWQRAQKRNTP